MSANPPSVTELEKLIEARADARKYRWNWGWRPDDPDAPGSVHSEGGYAVLMCPRYGKEAFPKDAEFVCKAEAWVSDHAQSLLAEREKDRARIERLENIMEYWFPIVEGHFEGRDDEYDAKIDETRAAFADGGEA